MKKLWIILDFRLIEVLAWLYDFSFDLITSMDIVFLGALPNFLHHIPLFSLDFLLEFAFGVDPRQTTIITAKEALNRPDICLKRLFLSPKFIVCVNNDPVHQKR